MIGLGRSTCFSARTKAKVDDDASPIPKVAYHTLKEKRLREMLADHDLPNNGDKDTLIKRHERWALLYNANLDRTPTDRLTLEDLRRELKKWETERQTKRQAVTDLNAYQVIIAFLYPRSKILTTAISSVESKQSGIQPAC